MPSDAASRILISPFLRPYPVWVGDYLRFARISGVVRFMPSGIGSWERQGRATKTRNTTDATRMSQPMNVSQLRSSRKARRCRFFPDLPGCILLCRSMNSRRSHCRFDRNDRPARNPLSCWSSCCKYGRCYPCKRGRPTSIP